VDYTKFLQVLKDEILRRLQTLTRSGSQAACSLTMLRLSMPQPDVLRMLFIALLLAQYGICALTSWRHTQQQCQEQASHCAKTLEMHRVSSSLMWAYYYASMRAGRRLLAQPALCSW
jgi:hypothetical protein